MSSSARLPWPAVEPPPPPPRGFIPPPPPIEAPAPTLVGPIFAEGPVLLPPRSPGLRWKWKHLWAFWFAAFALPGRLLNLFAPQERVSEFLDAMLYFQLVGYVLAVLIAIQLVRREQNGDWSSLGLSWRGNVGLELASGAAFGLLLLGAFTAVAYAVTRDMQFDQLVKVLVGSTNGLGFALAAVVVVIGAPVIEEIYYRGLLYEKLARKNIALAIGVTAVLFTVAHGALFIPGIILMGLALAWQRRTRSLWYTIGAHGAWNLTVVLVASFVLLGGWSFSPSDHAYTVELPKAWERVDPASVRTPLKAPVDVAIESALGSTMTVMRVPAVNGSALETLELVQQRIERRGMPGAYVAPIQSHDHLFDQGAESLHLPVGFDMGGQQVASHWFVLLKPGASDALLMNLVCVREACVDDGGKLDEAIHGLRFAD